MKPEDEEAVSFCGIGFQPVELFREFDRLEAYPTTKNHSLEASARECVASLADASGCIEIREGKPRLWP